MGEHPVLRSVHRREISNCADMSFTHLPAQNYAKTTKRHASPKDRPADLRQSQVLRWLGLAVPLLAVAFSPLARAEIPSAVAIQQDLRSFRETATVLYVAAHPDDENTQFIAYFARGRSYRTAYLSLTRGDGGQNELGADFDQKLGVLRTQELLAARRIDGGRQFFSRAIDFGFSKNPEETLRFWDHDKVLGDVVRVIRQFRPDVIVTRFPIPPGSGGHGHHTASAMLAVEAFKLAGNPASYPEQLAQGLSPWQPKRILWNSWDGGRSTGGLDGPIVRVDIGGDDPVTGEPFGTIANRSRGMHKTQGLGGFSGRTASGPNPQSFMLLAGEPATQDIMDGVDLTWNRIPGGADIGPLANDLLAKFDPKDPAASVPALLAIRTKLAALSTDPLVADKRAQLDHLLQACLGLEVSTAIAHADAVPGESIALHQTAIIHSNVPVRWLGTQATDELALVANQSVTRESSATIPIDAPLSQPYWLREAPAEGLYSVSDPSLIGLPENPPALLLQQRFEVGGQTLVVADEPVAVASDRAELRRPLEVVAPVSFAWSHPLELLAPGAARTVTLELTAGRAGVDGTLQLEAPAGWKITPTARKFHLGASGEHVTLTFDLIAPAQPADAHVSIRAAIGPRRYHRGRTELHYAHLPMQLLQPDAVLHAVACDVAVQGRKLGYVPGAGDDVATSLRLLGCDVTDLAAADLTAENLHAFDAVVIGVRAFNENKAVASALPALLGYVENGGVVIAQYNRPNGLESVPLGPYPLSIQGPAPLLRVTDETVPVGFLAPDHRALNAPNKIHASDFEGWVQERGSYFPSTWDESHYTAILTMSDPGEKPLKGSLLVAKHGRGWFVYTGVSFFRQLPAGVPGAYRLFANLVSLGK
jgi:LmbE family N-acetylglucosaminyl deacetylase